ncbi:MAG: hypothetical protein ABSB28_07010 [Candidatus Bathyarchaeia archaeon]
MKNNLAKILSALMIVTALLGFAAVLPTFAVNPQPNAYVIVDPALNSFNPPPVVVTSTFNVNVSLVNITNVAGVQYELKWNPTLLACTGITEILFHTWTPSAKWSNINGLALSYNNTGGYADYAQSWVDLPTAESDGYAPGNVTPSTSPPTTTDGKWATATFTFKILVLPTMAEGNLTCDFTFNYVKIGNPDGDKIIDTPTSTGNAPIKGTYIVFWAPPSILPYFSVSSWTAHSLGEVFNIYVYVNKLDPGWEAVGFEFKLSYNASLMNLISVDPGSPWLGPFSVFPDSGILNLTNSGTGWIQVGRVVLPDGNGTWHTPFPSAADPNPTPLVVLTFNATMQGVFPTVLGCPLHLYDTKIANWIPAPISQGGAVDGVYSILPSITGRVIDIYTGWPADFGGQGQNQPSDMYWPQKAVSLYANVTYNGWPEQQKDVAFQVIAPNNQTWAIIYARTDANGIAYTTFRLPWPCDNPEQWFGIWTIVGTVDIACNIVNDTLWFHYDYLVRIWKQTTDAGSYNHTDYVTVTIGMRTYLQQTDAMYLDEITNSTMDLSSVTVVVTAFDEVRVPYGLIDAQVQFTTPISANSTTVPFGGPWPYENITGWCHYKEINVTLTVYIPKFAVAGTSEIDCAVLNNWPYFGGTVISGFQVDATHWLPYDPTFINILAQ